RDDHRNDRQDNRNDRRYDNRRDNDHRYVVTKTVARPISQVTHVVAPQPVYVTPVVNCGPVAMNPATFSQLQCTINNAAFESTKLVIFKQALAYNYFTANQVLALMNQFSFESTKLQVSELAYTKTVDPGNYYIVNNAFAFGSSSAALGNYIAML
ncbi:MAG TPA: DUF4476 domain-containing protein, partial [Chitinophagales bacterium]|nr:DUF4476 domain-containing protein [Chitinophagales bacterium]